MEGGIRTHNLSAIANVSGSSGFLWLLSLCPYQWSTIYFEGNIPSLFESQITAEWGSRLVYQFPHPTVCIDLVACTSKESSKLSEVPYARVVLLTTPIRWVSLAQFLSIKHRDVGGVTTHESKFLLFKCPTVELQQTVQRSIGCVIEHKRHLPSSDHADNCITSDDLLPIRAINTLIRLQRWNVSGSGYTTRSLASTELCSAFDLPKWCLPEN